MHNSRMSPQNDGTETGANAKPTPNQALGRMGRRCRAAFERLPAFQPRVFFQ